MDQPLTAVMRRMLEMNYGLFYSRAALQDNMLQIIFDSDIVSASPNKMYYGLKEMALKSDALDDVLVNEFDTLGAVNTEHILPVDATELDVKYRYFQQWIKEILDNINGLNQDSYSGTISYLLLGLIYRLDYMIAPEGDLLASLEDIHSIYWRRDPNLPLTVVNQNMTKAFLKLQQMPKDEFAKSIYRIKSTFAVANPINADQIKETIDKSNNESRWYIENKMPDIATIVNEYGMSYNQFSASMPNVITKIFHIYMMAAHPNYFEELGFKNNFTDKTSRILKKENIQRALQDIVNENLEKHPNLSLNFSSLKYESVYDFGYTLSNQIANFNLDAKKA